MPSIWQRHPRYAFLALLVFACTLYLFYPIQQRSVFKPIYIFKENTLANRLARSDHIYEKALSSRQDMIKKFGPSPKEIALYVLVSMALVMWYVENHGTDFLLIQPLGLHTPFVCSTQFLYSCYKAYMQNNRGFLPWGLQLPS